MSNVEVYKVASFYANFDSVRDGDKPPLKITIKVCKSLSCKIYESDKSKDKKIERIQDQDIRIIDTPCMVRFAFAPVLEIGHFHVQNANLEKVFEAIDMKWN